MWLYAEAPTAKIAWLNWLGHTCRLRHAHGVLSVHKMMHPALRDQARQHTTICFLIWQYRTQSQSVMLSTQPTGELCISLLSRQVVPDSKLTTEPNVCPNLSQHAEHMLVT